MVLEKLCQFSPTRLEPVLTAFFNPYNTTIGHFQCAKNFASFLTLNSKSALPSSRSGMLKFT